MMNPISHREVIEMKNIHTFFAMNAVLIILLVVGFVYVNSETAQSEQALEISFLEYDAQDMYQSVDQGVDFGIEVAKNTCGSETCSDSECCCLNVDNGNQCCRPNQGGNCVEACKNSPPC